MLAARNTNYRRLRTLVVQKLYLDVKRRVDVARGAEWPAPISRRARGRLYVQGWTLVGHTWVAMAASMGVSTRSSIRLSPQPTRLGAF